MKLEDQACSLELAKRLKKLNVKQDSYFFWNHFRSWVPSDYQPAWAITDYPAEKDASMENVSAFTVAELGEIMTEAGHGVVSKVGMTACATLVKKEWWITGGNWLPEKQKYDHLETDPKWANALAKMLIHLIEKGIIKL